MALPVVFNLPGSVCPQGGSPNTLSTIGILPMPVGFTAKASHTAPLCACSITCAGLLPSPPCFTCRGFSSCIPYGGITDLGIRAGVSRVSSWQGIREAAASVLNLSPPHPGGCTATLSSSQPATRFCSRLVAAGRWNCWEASPEGRVFFSAYCCSFLILAQQLQFLFV